MSHDGLKILTKHAKLDVVSTCRSDLSSFFRVNPRLLAELVVIKLTAASVSQIYRISHLTDLTPTPQIF